MAINVTLGQLTTLNNTSILGQSNTNFSTIQTALTDAVSRSGQSPNAMESSLDMNSNQIINLPAPGTVNSPARLIDVTSNPTIQVPPTGTSGHTVPYLDGNNTWSGTSTFTNTVTLPSGSVTGTEIASTTITGSNLVNNTITNTQIANNTVGNTQLAQMAANTIKGNNTGSTANSADLTATQTRAVLAVIPTIQRFISGTSLTYTTPSNISYIKVRMCAGGGGGSADDTNNGAVGTNTSFGSWTAIHGNGGTTGSGVGGAGGTGGVNGTGTLIARLSGGSGQGGSNGSGSGGSGGNSPFGGGAGGGNGGSGGTGQNAAANTGSGGGGGGSVAGDNSGAGGGAGEFVEFIMSSVQVGASQTYTVGTGGNGGAAGTVAGGNGAAGIIIVEEYYI